MPITLFNLNSEDTLKLALRVIDSASDIILIAEAEPIEEPGPRIVYVNKAFVNETGFSASEVIGKTPRILQGPKTDKVTIGRISAALKKWQPIREEVLNYKKNGEEFWQELNIFPVTDQSGRYTHWVSIQRNISARKTSEKIHLETKYFLEQSQQRLILATDAGGIGIWDWNILTGEVKHNQCWIELLGEDPGQTYFSVEDFKNRIHPEDLSVILDRLNVSLATGKEYQAKYKMVRGDGRVVWVEDKGAIVERSESGEPLRMVSTIKDISEQVAAQEKIQELIFFDSLTNLPNRQYIQDRIHRTISESARNKTYSGLMFLDLDNFKNVNDTYGHNIGDVLLKEFGARIQKAIRPKDIVARIGGDEFLILFEEIGTTLADAKKILEEAIERILEGFTEHHDLGDGVYVQAKASIGIVIFGDQESQFDDIFKYADLAMYAAKSDPHLSHRFFDIGLMEQFKQKSNYFARLKNACALKQISTVYQPVVDRNQDVVAYEALARWNDPEFGIVMPDDFIPFAEKNGLIIEVGNTIIENIFSNQDLWNSPENDQQPDVMINISAHQLMNLGFAKKFIASCEQFHIPMNRIHLEITESINIGNVDAAIEVMLFLNKQGVKFALDDFGTGFSSLTYLQKLPIQYLKIDKSFVAGLGVSSDDEAIATNILILARGLGIKVIAEGVETQAQFEWLLSKGCDYFQGWYFGHPVDSLKF
ncbi:EAL domain-containing protein [Polynucleobacter sp. MWH-Mekk-B1]|uniref:GGDEF domain-containing phosphodiesterase n=1 Tax=Polynucleobacter finlandensis TaxID=1855894 RepID=UPI001C0B12CF|nr:GGDEF domain-containing phosphodiesterase [Polynucleobacter finlandensis]MBU3544321.1 EAL domain-containing protein [Polynucleobacter finlandensis]